MQQHEGEAMYIEYRPKEANTPQGWAKMLRADPLAHLKLRLDPRWRFIRKNLKSPLLDAGCGRGDWVSSLARAGYQASGLDYSVEMTEFNRAHHPRCEFFCGRIQAMPIADGRFNSIVSWGVIEHDPEGPEAALSEFYRVLMPRGRILVTVPVDNDAHRCISQMEFPEREGSFFQYFFTQEELAEHVSQAGFRILETGYSSRPHPALIWPRAYNDAGRLRRRLLQLGALFADKRFGNMIYCFAEKPAQQH